MEKNVNTIITETVTGAVREPVKTAGLLYGTIRWLIRVFVSAIERFYWDNGFSRAASLAYTSLLSLVPVTFVGFGFLTSFVSSNQDLVKVREFIFRQFVPNQATVSIILDKLSEIDKTLNDPNFSVAAIAFFAVTALLLINSIEFVLNEIWQVYEPRSIAQRLSIFCAIIVIGPVLVLSAYYTTKVRLEPFITGLGVSDTVNLFFNHLLTFAIDFFAFFLLYFLVPKAPVRLSAAAFGALCVSILFDLAKYYFTVYIVHFSSYDRIYGAMATIPIFLFWLYITWSIVLFGSELSYQFQHLPLIGKIRKRQVTSVGDGALLLACQCVVIIARSFEEGKTLPDELELTEKLGCSSIILRPTLYALKRAGIISKSESRDQQLMLQKSPEKIKLTDIVKAVYQDRGTVQYPKEVGRFFEACADKERGEATTIKDLLAI